MNETIAPSDIYDKTLIFSSVQGLIWLVSYACTRNKKEEGRSWSLEDLATHFENTEDPRLIPLFMHYYVSCIQPAQVLKLELVIGQEKQQVIRNYRDF